MSKQVVEHGGGFGGIAWEVGSSRGGGAAHRSVAACGRVRWVALLGVGALGVLALGCSAPTPKSAEPVPGAGAPAVASGPTANAAAAVARTRLGGRDALPAGSEPGLRAAYIRSVQRAAGTAYAPQSSPSPLGASGPVDALPGLHARNQAQDFTLAFDRVGVELSRSQPGSAATLRLALQALGRAGDRKPVAAASALFVADGRVEYARSGGLVEWYVNGPLGLEQGFTVSQRAAGQQPLELAIGVGEKLRPVLSADGTVIELAVAGGSAVLRYGELYVEDAEGEAVPARLLVDDGQIVLSIDDARAAYPLVIDPLVWVETRLDRPGDIEAEDNFGTDIAGDGDTVVITSRRGNDANGVGTGAAYVFERAAKRWVLVQKLLPSDGVLDGGFGSSVAIDGNTILVGALPLLPGSYTSGAGYVFVHDGAQWNQTQKLTAAPAETDDSFGSQVALDGDEAFIGAWMAGASGAVYRFVRDGGAFAEAQTIVPDDAELSNYFGCELDVHGDTLVVGAYGNNEKADNAGAAYVFVRDGSQFRQSQKLLASDGATGDALGMDLALDGDTLLAGAPNHAGGAVYAFERTAGPFVETQKLTGSGTVTGSAFGLGIDLQGDTALIGALWLGPSGSAFVFERGPSGFVERDKLVPADSPSDGRFGRAVALAGNTALGGAFYDSSVGLRMGSAYSFEREGSDWVQAQKLSPNVLLADQFGLKLAVSGETVIVTANQDGKSAVQAGSAYVFTRDGGAWTIQQELVALDPVAYDNFGFSVDVDADTALIGAWAKTGGQGAAYVFVRSGETWSQQAKLTSSMPVSNGHFGAQVALDGDTAVVVQQGVDAPVFVFTRSVTTWSAPQLLLPPAGAETSDIAVSGDSLALAASNGTTRLYARASGTWSAGQTLTDSGATSLDGDSLVIGHWDYMDNADLGDVAVYARSSGTWSSAGTISPPPGTTHGHRFGRQVALSGDTVLVAAQGLYDGAVAQSGGGYVYTRSAPGAAFSLVQLLQPSHPGWTHQVGIAADLDGQTAVLGGFNEAFVWEGVNPGANGDACYLDTECQNGHCVDGICCNVACDGGCEACSQNEKADASADGSCGLIAAGRRCGPAPMGCASQTAYRLASTCTAGGVCQANSSTCADHYACVGNSSDGQCVTSCLNQGVPDHLYCTSSYYCDAGDCVPDKTVGDPCSEGAQCLSNTCTGGVCLGSIGDACDATPCALGFCVDGHCCSTICNGTCEACGESGQEGSCVAVTGAPRGSRSPCVADAECGGSCNGSARNACTYPGSGQSCQTPSCAIGQVTTHHCNGGGACVAGSPQSCAPYVSCADAQSCATSCGNDADCASNHFCDDLSDTCLPDRLQASSCNRDNQCVTGSCADGVCCNTDCGEQCEACAEAGKVGTCSAVVGDPRGGRAACAGGGSACEGACDGASRDGCLYPNATSCGSSTCSLAVAYGALCNGLGACVTNTVGQSCFPYAACADGTQCLSSCTGNTQCAAGQFCDTIGTPDQCVAQRIDGAACDDAAQCASGFCADGVCCNVACTGQCEACAESGSAGLCVPVEGTPRGARTACDGSDDDDNPCAGSCGGSQRDSCDYPAEGTACEAAACDGAVLTPARVCDGAGVCGLESTQDCGAYSCDASENRCNSRCQSRGDCAAGALCRLDVRECAFVPSVCVDAFTVELADGSQSSCDGHRCTAGECQERCADDNDCAPSYLCLERACVLESEVPSESVPDAGTAPPDAGAESPTPPAEALDAGESATSPPTPSEAPDAGTLDGDPAAGCGCRVPGARRGALPSPLPVLVLFALAALRLRRRRAR